MRRLLLSPLCLAAALLAGCGNKGPLYLPNSPSPSASVVAPAQAQSAPATAESAPAPASSSATH